jgi:hypothetical protein
MTRIVLIGGTWSWRGHRTVGEWYQEGLFTRFLEDAGYDVACKTRPFIWTSRVNGLWFQKHRHLDWDAAGANLSLFLDWTDKSVGVKAPVDIVIAHSHALQVILYACAYHGASIPKLISVSSPVRHDMSHVAKQARPRIGKWLHLASDWTDRMQWLGELCDGGWRIRRSAVWKRHGEVIVAADRNVRYPGLGHSGLVRNPDLWPLWLSQGWLTW